MMRGLLGAFTFAAAFVLASGGSPAPDERPRSAEPSFMLPCQFSSFSDDSALYLHAYRDAPTSGEIPPGGRICCGTVSHHLFIGSRIAAYFNLLARLEHPRLIVLLGPNHKARGHAPIALSGLPWKTPFGFVHVDTSCIGTLERSGIARIDEEAFLNEHSIGALVPFIAHSLPGACIVPVIFRKDADRSACRQLAQILCRAASDGVVLASLDFSHYKKSAEAEQEDRSSLRVMDSFDDGHVDRAFVDSRGALCTLLCLCRLEGARDFEIVDHTNSGIIAHRPQEPCTSYINALFRLPAASPHPLSYPRGPYPSDHTRR